MAAQKKVEVKVGTDVEDSEVDALEKQINNLKQQKIQLKLESDTAKLDETKKRIENLKIFLDTVNSGNTNIHINDEEIKKAESELKELEGKVVDLEINVAKDKLDSVKSEVEELDDTEIDLNIENSTALQSIDQISQGFDRLKQGASEVGAVMGEVLTAAGKQETNKTFLEMAVGADQAAQSMQTINEIVQNLPGDDTAVQGLLSQAIAKDASLTADTLSSIGTAYADYASAMSFYGKSSIEAQQDMTNYILAGNTAELERSPILASHIDKLKEANTIQERAQVLQEALNEEHWGGMSQQDTYNNKLETFNGMLERGRYNLGGMLQEGAKWGMDFLMNLDAASGGLVGMGIALGEFASPITDTVMGLGQMATGMKAIKDLGMIKWLKDLEIVTKLSAAADWLLSGAQAVLNAVMSMNPIILVVLALVALTAAVIWAYYNVDWFREMVDNAWASLVQLGQQIYGVVAGAIQWLGDLFNQFTSQLGLNTNDWIQAVLGFILFIPQLPLQLGVALVNAIAKSMGFGNNFVQTMINAGANAVNGFVSWISQLPGKLAGELNAMLGMARNFVMQIANLLTGGAAGMVIGWITGSGEHSPGYMYDAFAGELNAMEKRAGITKSRLPGIMGAAGKSLNDNFNPNLDTMNNRIMSGSLGNQINNFNFEDIVVDDDDRMRRIVEFVTRELHWNNKTAGRTI